MSDKWQNGYEEGFKEGYDQCASDVMKDTELNYVTMGQQHIHKINGQVIDRNCVAVFESEKGVGRRKAFELFDVKFCFHYPENEWNRKLKDDPDMMQYYPRGYIRI